MIMFKLKSLTKVIKQIQISLCVKLSAIYVNAAVTDVTRHTRKAIGDLDRMVNSHGTPQQQPQPHPDPPPGGPSGVRKSSPMMQK